MVLPLIPIAIVGAGALVGTGAFLSKDENITTNYQTTNQTDFISNETVFDLSNSFFESGSNIDLTSNNTVTTKKGAKQESAQPITNSGDLNTLLLIGGAAILGGYLILKK